MLIYFSQLHLLYLCIHQHLSGDLVELTTTCTIGEAFSILVEFQDRSNKKIWFHSFHSFKNVALLKLDYNISTSQWKYLLRLGLHISRLGRLRADCVLCILAPRVMSFFPITDAPDSQFH
jgi:hypothetical protein